MSFGDSHTLSAEMVEVLSRMVTFDATQRGTAAELLQSAFFADASMVDDTSHSHSSPSVDLCGKQAGWTVNVPVAVQPAPERQGWAAPLPPLQLGRLRPRGVSTDRRRL